MKPPPFEYLAPRSIDEALAALAQHGDGAKLLAGGQSLIPAMNFRLLSPSVLIDMNGIEELAIGGPLDDGGLRLGAMTRQSQVEKSQLVAERVPLLHGTMPYIAHPQIRNRGTIGGSLVHADPASELPAVCLALDANFHARSASGTRIIPAQEFFQFLFTTALAPDEILMAIDFPALSPTTGWAFVEFSRRLGDYALLGLAALVSVDRRGRIDGARLVYLNAGETPVDARAAAQMLIGEAPSDELFRAAAHHASTQEIAPMGSVHATPDYQRHLARILTVRALRQATHRAQGGQS
ncbi:MAG: xanthine dehydrogenase family protein subunit M [Caldilineaceae bacterium]|nr:xanthine dehydrogenase family protein subunit M [Caldilineaceae bacterium]MBP9075030.1 xanthine dehydrogenase family protein subunit M [Caldilineaceae bacterium]